MDAILEKLSDWIRSLLISGIMRNLSGIFDSVNTQAANIASEVGTTPADFSPEVFSMIRQVSETVILPIAGVILTFIACVELIQMIIDHNNLASFETWFFFRWVIKTFAAVLVISNTFPIVMAVFEAAQQVVQGASGIIGGDAAISADTLTDIRTTLDTMEVGEVFGLFLQSMIIQLLLQAIAIVIFIIVYGRMIEIYLTTSLAPIPLATFGNREQSQMGQNYLRSLAALGLQGLLILICVGIYSVLISEAAISEDLIASLWGVVGYSVLLCFTLFKTGALARGILSAR